MQSEGHDKRGVSRCSELIFRGIFTGSVKNPKTSDERLTKTHVLIQSEKLEYGLGTGKKRVTGLFLECKNIILSNVGTSRI